jgi:hypothetical protein
MIILPTILVFFATFCLYNTSKRAKLSSEYPVEKLLQQQPKMSKGLALTLLVLALALFINTLGLGSAVFFWLSLIMLCLGLVVMLSPMSIFNYKHISALLFLLFMIETLV